ncbi:Alpha beta hydrolase [Seminavis robusta]|uniref:Alpha beta hydrolase n=1 Tax=Seminavis robusta TaxID=568900 RepID=A0A9N8DBI9_9STRA|nr:Alpha beta hydrolase [Seminavis robusta]|eukprot:Sro24_g016450.1 Alpha beta hydrolase (288) ;mRNA; r:97857-98720
MSLSLSTTSATQSLPVVLIHGLDSSKETWDTVLPKLQQREDFSATAMDCRGCGRHPLPDLIDEEFSIEALVQDVQDHLEEVQECKTNNNKLVLLGHSMGARVALAFAATYPERVACLIMEDMDIGRRRITEAPFVVPKPSTPFSRSFPTRKDAMEALVQAGYPQDRIDRWIQDGRIFPNNKNNSGWWSSVNPDFRRLCYDKVVDNDSGVEQCQSLASNPSSFPIHVLVGGPDNTICRPESLQEMTSILGQDRVTIHQFPPESTHSIHSSHQDEYMATINGILDTVAK